jgi:hypothetical protein
MWIKTEVDGLEILVDIELARIVVKLDGGNFDFFV